MNRYAVSFDVCVVNLENAAVFFPDSKRSVAVATQIMGTGKTCLGRNVINVLNRPREATLQEEKLVEKRLLQSRMLLRLQPERRKSVISRARSRDGNEALVTRALREFRRVGCDGKENLVDTVVDGFKQAETVTIDFNDLDEESFSLERAIKKNLIQYFNLTGDVGGLVSSCQYIVANCLQGRPLFLVFDEIGQLVAPKFAKWLSVLQNQDENMYLKSMRLLSFVLQSLLRQKNVYVFCMGRSNVLSLEVISGDVSPLNPRAILLQPLSDDDICKMFALYSAAETSDINLSAICTEPKIIRYLASQLVLHSGGNGRIIEKTLMIISKADRLPLKRKKQVDDELQYASNLLDSSLFYYDKSDESVILESDLLERVGDLMTNKKTFNFKDMIMIGGRQLPFRDALNMIGFSFAPASNNNDNDSEQMFVVAGNWHIERLPDAIKQSKKAIGILNRFVPE